MIYFLHYRLRDGEIMQQELTRSGSAIRGIKIGAGVPKPRPGCGVIEIKGSAGVFPSDRFFVDLNSKEIVEKSAEQKAAIGAANDAQKVRQAVTTELARTDQTQLADYPISDDERTAWRAYRQSLRDLSKKGFTVAQQIAAWPKAPDGRKSPFPVLGDEEISDVNLATGTFHVFDKENS